MRKCLGVSLAFLLAMSIVALGAAPVQATPPTPVDTVGVIQTSEAVLVRNAGGNLFLSVVTTVTYTGTWDGFATSEFDVVFYRNGATSARGVITCEVCTVEDKTGTLIFQVRFLLDADGVLQASSWHFVEGTGELANIHGQGHLEQLEPFPTTTPFRFVGQYHFDP